MQQDLVTRYRNVPVLSREEEQVLIHRWRTMKDDLALDRLVQGSMRHVVAMAMKMRGYPVSFGDLVSEGSLGLLVAIEKFDPDRGFRLVTYSNFWIKAYMYRAVIKEWSKGRTGLGRRRYETFFKLRKALAGRATREGIQQLDHAELATEVGVTVEEMGNMLDALRIRELALDSEQDGELSWYEKLADGGPSPEEQAVRRCDDERLRCRIEHAMTTLTEREQLILRERLLNDDPPSLTDIGNRIGVTRERVRQIQVHATEKLRVSLAA
jgi:RNA polymerase sigma-32 factor